MQVGLIMSERKVTGFLAIVEVFGCQLHNYFFLSSDTDQEKTEALLEFLLLRISDILMEEGTVGGGTSEQVR